MAKCLHAWQRCDIEPKHDEHGNSYALKKCLKCGKTEWTKRDGLARGAQGQQTPEVKT